MRDCIRRHCEQRGGDGEVGAGIGEGVVRQGGERAVADAAGADVRVMPAVVASRPVRVSHPAIAAGFRFRTVLDYMTLASYLAAALLRRARGIDRRPPGDTKNFRLCPDGRL